MKDEEEFEKFKDNLEKQKKKVDEKINPILQSYKEEKITARELVEKLSDAFYSLEKEECGEDERKEKSKEDTEINTIS